METNIENVNFATVETMESEDSGEVQYVYDENQMMLGGTDDIHNITDLVLEDGTRAMIVNGTLVTADGQTLILQDDNDLSQYYVDDNTDQILLSEDQGEQFLKLMSPQNPQTEEQVVQYIQGSNDNTPFGQEEILYIHEDQQVWPIQEQYQLAEVESENGVVSMQVVKLDSQQVVEGVEGVIDLEHFLSQQGLVHLDGGNNYQYAILKDGKFHIQTIDEPVEAEILKDQNSSAVNSQAITESSTQLSRLGLSTIKGKDINTGQPITLSKYTDKVYTRNKEKNFGNNNENNQIICQAKQVTDNTITSANVALRNLINKKITIGKTDKGKLLIGKIINVTKKTESNADSFKKNTNVASRKKITLPPKKNKKQLFNAKEVLNFANDDDDNDPSGNTDMQNKNSCARTNISKISPAPASQFYHNNDQDVTAIHSSNLESSQTSNAMEALALNPVPNTPSISERNEQEITLNAEDSSQHYVKDRNRANTDTSPEQSKIVVHKKVVTKDCFNVITKTLVGLMNMESVVKKLKNKTIIIKIIEKNYNLETGDYSRNVSYCTGYMVREYKLSEEADNFSETWRFIPDSNSQDTILGEDNWETVLQDPSTTQNNLKKIANLTIQITVNDQGSRTTRVIINPPNMYKCKECTKSFRTSSALKVHSSEHQASFIPDCTICSIKFKTHQESKEHLLMHQTDDNQGMYECMDCNKRFGTSLLLRKHMEIHFKPVNCTYCNQCFSNMRDLNKHLPLHFQAVPQPPSVPAILKKGSQDSAGIIENPKPQEQKLYYCHICGRQFSRHSNLQRHIEIHQGEGAMYKCAICNCSYHYVSSLTRHVVTCHVDTTKRSQNSYNYQKEESSSQSSLQFLEEGQIVEMIPLEDMGGENLQYVTGTLGNVTQNLRIEQGVEILQIPVDEGGVVLEN